MRFPKSRRVRLALGAVAALVIAGVAVAAVLVLHKPGNVSHPNVEFTAPPTTATQPAPAPAPKPKATPVNNFLWARYGYDAARTRFFDPGPHLTPPFRIGWRFQDYALLEFPPVIAGNTMFANDDDASAKAIDIRNGHKLWETKLGTLAAASPAVAPKQGLIIVPILSLHGHSPGGGAIFALSMKTGKIVWRHDIGAGTESSPLAMGNNVYFGDQAGTVYSMRASDGHVNWTYHASGAVKGGPAFDSGDIFFGDYAGRAYALNANTGHEVWAVGTNGTRFGFGSGNFYATAAVAFGRVYLGNTDGRVYSFAEHSGRLAWATGTSAYVYSSAAVDDTPGLGPTVYVGSYDGNFYAFDARSGAIRWTHHAGGRISGSPTIVHNVVYYADLGDRNSAGLDVRTGRQVFTFHDGAFNPVIADMHALYAIGYSMIYQLLPRHK